MGKSVYIAEKPSVAREFAKALRLSMANRDGYMESEEAFITWCVGHLVTMSYPEAYDEKYKRWTLDTLPFLPQDFRYEVISSVAKQFRTVSMLLNRADVDTIYVCTDSGREGEYIYRLVEQQAGVTGKVRKRVWIDSQTQEEILRGIREAKDLSEYDNLCAAAYLRAKEDYLMGINFSRVLTLKYSQAMKAYLKTNKAVVSVGRVMTCVLGMVVAREREIREFVKTPFYRVLAKFAASGEEGGEFDAEWRTVEGTRYAGSPLLYKENGFKEEADAKKLIASVTKEPQADPILEKIEKKKETKHPPLLYNLAELQNDCAKYFKISPDETLKIVQQLYEQKMVTYPRTDARVLSTAAAKEIEKNIRGLLAYGRAGAYAAKVLGPGGAGGAAWQKLAATRYVDDKQITDHYALIPTGQGLSQEKSLSPLAASVYELIARRFLSIFYPPAVYKKISLAIDIKGEKFFSSFRALEQEGYLCVVGHPAGTKKESGESTAAISPKLLAGLKKGMRLQLLGIAVKEGETSPPKRYNSGTMILTMENAGQFIEDEDLRAQIKGSGIGTSATRAEILKKLVHIKYLSLNKKTQIITPTLMGEMVYDVVRNSMKPLLEPALTASWEKGLSLVAEGKITPKEYMGKLEDFVSRRTNTVKQMQSGSQLYAQFDAAAKNYK